MSERTWSDAYRMDDGRVLLVYRNGKGVVYPSYASLDEMLSETEELVRQGPVDLVRELLPPAEDFIRDVATHAAKLAARLRLPEETLDGTLDSLHAVDQGFRRLKRDKRMTAEVITPLTAYIGEILRRAFDEGRWATMERGGSAAPVPIVVGRDGRYAEPFTPVLHALDPDQRSSLHGAVDAALEVRVFKPRMPPT